jgi:hypothetical protein
MLEVIRAADELPWEWMRRSWVARHLRTKGDGKCESLNLEN